jgi:hypothetical protein
MKSLRMSKGGTEMMSKIPWKGLTPTNHLPRQIPKEVRKRKRKEDLKSSGTLKSLDVPHDLATSSAPPLMLSLFDLAGIDS